VIGAGVRWQEVLDTAQVHDLAGLAGSASPVGVVGYALGGGAGWLARRYGLCSDMIEAAEVTTSDGVRRWVSPDSEPDLLWALRGGGSNFGVVTALRLGLVPAPIVYAGAVYWPMSQSEAILSAEAEAALTSMRRIPGIVLDTARSMPFREIGSVTMDSPLHLPRIGYSESLREVTDEIIGGLPEILTPGEPYLAMELRHTSGGIVRPPESYEGLGYWNSAFLFFGMCITPDPATELRAKRLGERLNALLTPSRTGTNAFTFLLAQHTPVGEGEAERVRSAFRPAHYARLAKLKGQYDPLNRLGGDRAIAVEMRWST
jgi:hypothetical protein